MNRLVLEIIAERKVPQHLKKRMVARCLADLVEVVVLAARTYAFLRGRRPLIITLLDAEEHVLELIHPCVGEQQRRVVRGQKRRRMNSFVPILLKIGKEFLSDLVTCHLIRI